MNSPSFMQKSQIGI